MNWNYFLLFLFIIHVLGMATGTIEGAFEQEKSGHFTKAYGAICFAMLVALVLMWFWT